MKGLILAGGSGSRLGTNKAFISVHGEPQVNYLIKQFRKLSIPAFVGVRSDKLSEFREFSIIEDDPNIKGPLASIAAAFKHESGPWLVVAVDMPFINENVIKYLIQNRDPDKMATSFTVDEINPEPMISLWENSCKDELGNFIMNGGNSPIEFLRTHPTQLVKAKDPLWVFNINDENDLLKAKQQLKSFRS